MSQDQPTYSFELFPPKTPEGMEKLKAQVERLNAVGPRYFSCTYGAAGSTRERTFETVAWLRGQGIDTAPHLACIGSSRAEVAEILDHYRAHGIRRIVALRGDLPSGMGMGAERGLPLRQRAGRLHPRRARRLVPHRGRRLPRVSPPGPERGQGPGQLPAQGRGRGRRRHHPVLLQRRRLFRLRRCLRRHGARPAGGAGHHAHHQLHPARPLLRRLRGRDPALDPAALEGYGGRPGGDPRLRPPGRRSTCAAGCSPAGPRGCTSTP